MPKGLPWREAVGVEVLMVFGKQRSLEHVEQRFMIQRLLTWLLSALPQ